MTTDPNWLPSTLAQSTAALVAILGGFLVSRLVNLSSERGALGHRRKDLMARRGLLQVQRQEADQERLAVCIDWLWDLALDDIVAERGRIDVEAHLADWVPRGSDVAEMRPYADRLVAEVARAFTRVQAAYSGSVFPSEDLGQLRQDLGEIPPGFEKVYKNVAGVLASERRARSSSTRFSSIERLKAMQTISAAVSTTSNAEIQRHDTNIATVKERTAAISAIDAEVRLIDEEQVRFSKPEGLIAGLWVLGFFAMVGVVLPMFYMALRPVPAGPFERGVLIAAFVLGFATLLIYLMVYLRRLQRSLSDETPASPLPRE